MANVHSVRMAAAVTNMLDDQKVDVTASLLAADGSTMGLPTGASILWASSDGSATVDNTINLDGTPSTNPLVGIVKGVKTVAGDPTISATVTNADGSVANPGTAPFHITIDPNELKVADVGMAVGTPIAQ